MCEQNELIQQEDLAHMITRFDPFRDANTLNQAFNRLFQSNLDSNRGHDELLTSGTFVPAVDIYEDEHNITLKLEVPGSRPERHRHPPGKCDPHGSWRTQV